MAKKAARIALCSFIMCLLFHLYDAAEGGADSEIKVRTGFRVTEIGTDLLDSKKFVN